MLKSTEQCHYWFVFQGEHLLVSRENQLLLADDEINPLQINFLRQHRLGTSNQTTLSCAEIPVDCRLPQDFEAIPFRKALDTIGDEWYVMAAKAFSVINWDKNHQYCGRCGGVTTLKSGNGFERICLTCSQTFYPRISPSMIVLINKGDEILMARSPHFTPGAYGLIAGFVEAGESIEATVHREVQEEVGIKIKNLNYFGSQAWPFPDSLMIAFTAEYESGELVIDSNEIEAAGWYRFDQLPGRPSYKVSLSSKLIDYFISKHHLQGK